jgi:hypothetical protein
MIAVYATRFRSRLNDQIWVRPRPIHTKRCDEDAIKFRHGLIQIIRCWRVGVACIQMSGVDAETDVHPQVTVVEERV